MWGGGGNHDWHTNIVILTFTLQNIFFKVKKPQSCQKTAQVNQYPLTVPVWPWHSRLPASETRKIVFHCTNVYMAVNLCGVHLCRPPHFTSIMFIRLIEVGQRCNTPIFNCLCKSMWWHNIALASRSVWKPLKHLCSIWTCRVQRASIFIWCPKKRLNWEISRTQKFLKCRLHSNWGFH